jgi:hypothetical protein
LNLKAKLATAFAAALVAAACAQPAAASIKVVDFTVHGGSWTHLNGVDGPYGLPDQPTVGGSVTLDTTVTNASAFLDLDYTTGTRTWTLADIGSGSLSFFSGDSLIAFAIFFTTPGNVLGSSNTAGIAEGANTIFCNGCVTVDSVHDPVAQVPEPSTWLLALLGFGGAGAMIRRQRAVAA